MEPKRFCDSIVSAFLICSAPSDPTGYRSPFINCWYHPESSSLHRTLMSLFWSNPKQETLNCVRLLFSQRGVNCWANIVWAAWPWLKGSKQPRSLWWFSILWCIYCWSHKRCQRSSFLVDNIQGFSAVISQCALRIKKWLCRNTLLSVVSLHSHPWGHLIASTGDGF